MSIPGEGRWPPHGLALSATFMPFLERDWQDALACARALSVKARNRLISLPERGCKDRFDGPDGVFQGRVLFRVDTRPPSSHKAPHDRFLKRIGVSHSLFGIWTGYVRLVGRGLMRMGECPERQRGRTVNPLATPSQVRVLLPPPFFVQDPRISSSALCV